VPEKRLVDLFNMLLNGNHLFLVLLRCSSAEQISGFYTQFNVSIMDFKAIKLLFCVVCLVRSGPEESSTKRKNGKKGKQKMLY